MRHLDQGDYGAINVLSKIGAESPVLALLDTYGICGPRIYMLYKDVCRLSIANTEAVLLATYRGIVSEQQLNTAIDNHGRGLDVATIVQQVQGRSAASGAGESVATL
jgi:hypothetical protein